MAHYHKSSVGEETHPTRHIDTLGGQSRWSRSSNPPNVSERHVGWLFGLSSSGVGQEVGCSAGRCQGGVVDGVVAEGSRARKPPNVSE